MNSKVMTTLVIGAIVTAFVLGRWFGREPASTEMVGQGPKILYYQDPMHPQYKSEKPGIAPDCGMRLVPVYADGGTRASTRPPGTVAIAQDKQQVIGVRIGEAEKSSGTRVVRTVGKVAPDETRLYRLNAPLDGFTEQVASYATGSLLKKDDLLLGIRNPDFLALQQTYLSSLNIQDRGKAVRGPELAKDDRNLQLAIATLTNVGISDLQLKELEHTRKSTDVLKVYSPVTGWVLARNVSPAQRVERGTELYRIADLTHIWILADLFGDEGESLHAGQSVRVSLPRNEKIYTALVSKTLPQFDPVTQTLKVRLELDNRDYVFRPDMLVDVEFPIRLPVGVTIPVDAIVDSGTTKTVFVDVGDGLFEPRAVQTGWRADNRVQIVKGISAGEHIVISGTFLVDSESHLQTATAAMASDMTHDPVCGMEIDHAKAATSGLETEFEEETHYFCSATCKRDFDKDPKKYIKSTDRKESKGRTQKARPPA